MRSLLWHHQGRWVGPWCSTYWRNEKYAQNFSRESWSNHFV